MGDSSEESAGFVERVCAIDIGKTGLVTCTRVPHQSNPARRVQEAREYGTTTPALLGLADWLHELGVELVAMEATSDYWKPVFYLLEAEGFAVGCSTPSTSRTCPAGPRPTSSMRCAWPRSSSAACADPAWCIPSRSASCAT